MFKSTNKSLTQILGKEYMETVTGASTSLLGMKAVIAEELAQEKIDFLPDDFVKQMESYLDKVGEQFVPGFADNTKGATTNSFREATDIKPAPISGQGYLRLGEDGRLYLSTKSEHYHGLVGHNFPGYRLLDNARKLGITNITHNNYRGFITRLLEKELIREINDIDIEDEVCLNKIINSRGPHVLNRVINLQTGSLAVEAGVKMMLARFYRLDESSPQPKYSDKTPVFFVLADTRGGRKANYHGTTIITQLMRDMWPGMYNKMEERGIIKICPVKINDFEDFKMKFNKYNQGQYKAAGFLHELILMNYGAIRLTEEFVQKSHKLCQENDTPVLVDEIQSCLWYPDMFLYKEYDVTPDFVVIGKGFPGGEYPASRIITTSDMDNLDQFGALVTNGQEELAALAYLITMEFVRNNDQHINEIGSYLEQRLDQLHDKYNNLIERIEGQAHLTAIHFYDGNLASQFVKMLKDGGIDISAQSYKEVCPPAALIKPPVITTRKMVDYLVDKMWQVLENIE